MARILLAEDDRTFGAVLKGELESEGYHVTHVIDGFEAVMETLTDFMNGQDSYDFVLLDIKMPRLDGIHALRIIRKLHPGIPSITFSGNAGSGEMAESIRAGAIRCLTKPFSINQLREEIRKHLSRVAEG